MVVCARSGSLLAVNANRRQVCGFLPGKLWLGMLNVGPDVRRCIRRRPIAVKRNGGHPGD